MIGSNLTDYEITDKLGESGVCAAVDSAAEFEYLEEATR